MRSSGVRSRGSRLLRLLVVLAIAFVCYSQFAWFSAVVDSCVGACCTVANQAVREALDLGGTHNSLHSSQDETAKDAVQLSTEMVNSDSFENRYYIAHLSKKDRENFDACYSSVCAFEESCTLPHKTSKESAKALFMLLSEDCPELMQLDMTNYRCYRSANGEVSKIGFYYRLTKKEYEAQLDAAKKAVSAILSCSKGLSERASYEYAYREIAKSVSYNLDTKNAGSAYGALVESSAKCDGISKAFQWVMNAMGLPCDTVCGKNKDGTSGHAWSMIRLDNAYYFADTTAALSEYGLYSDPLDYGYFGINRKAMCCNYDLYVEYREDCPVH